MKLVLLDPETTNTIMVTDPVAVEEGPPVPTVNLSSGQSESETTCGQATKDVERMLSQRLLQGYCLLEKACPACHTPLVKQDVASIDKYATLPDGEIAPSNSSISTTSNKQPNPVPGIAYCVQCQAHVVTRASEVELLERKQQKSPCLRRRADNILFV